METLDKPVPKPAEQLASRFMDEAEDFARKDPAKAVAAAVGAGLLLNILPTRYLVASASAVALTMLKPAMLTLGVLKAFELCSSQSHSNTPQ